VAEGVLAAAVVPQLLVVPSGATVELQAALALLMLGVDLVALPVFVALTRLPIAMCLSRAVVVVVVVRRRRVVAARVAQGTQVARAGLLRAQPLQLRPPPTLAAAAAVLEQADSPEVTADLATSSCHGMND